MKYQIALVRLAAVLSGLALVSAAQAVSPAPGGGYPNETTALGDRALGSQDNDTGGPDNTALGYAALFANTTGACNTAVGARVLYDNNGRNNTGVGYKALAENTTGNQNTALGFSSLLASKADNNTAVGYDSLLANTTGTANTADGGEALLDNTTGSYNVANGYDGLYTNTTGGNNTAAGTFALYFNKSGSGNVAAGDLALYRNLGPYNLADGYEAGINITYGQFHAAAGASTLSNNKTGDTNIVVGNSAGSTLTGSNNIDIYDPGVKTDSGCIRLGTQGTQTATYLAGISGVTVSGGVGVICDTNGNLGTVTSSARYKEDIKPMADASAPLLALKPVTFHYKLALDPAAMRQFGLVAEDVAQVDPGLVARDAAGQIYSVRYAAVNAMLLNEFLKDHRQVADQAGRAAAQDRRIAADRADVAQLQAGMAHEQASFEAALSNLQAIVRDQAAQLARASLQ